MLNWIASYCILKAVDSQRCKQVMKVGADETFQSHLWNFSCWFMKLKSDFLFYEVY